MWLWPPSALGMSDWAERGWQHTLGGDAYHQHDGTENAGTK